MLKVWPRPLILSYSIMRLPHFYHAIYVFTTLIPFLTGSLPLRRERNKDAVETWPGVTGV